MGEVSIGTSRGHVNMEISGRDLVSRADEATDWADQSIGEGEAEPDGGKEHCQRKKYENGRKTQFEAVPMSFKATPHVGDEGGVFRDLGRQRVDPPRGVEELPTGAGDRPNADEDVADAEEAAERLAVQGVLEVGWGRLGDQLLCLALRDEER